MFKKIYQFSIFLLQLLLITSCSQVTPHREIASITSLPRISTSTCTQNFHNFYFSTFKKSIHPEIGSIAQKNPQVLTKLQAIKGLIKTQTQLLTEQGEQITTQEFFTLLLDQKNIIANQLENLAEQQQTNLFFHDTLLDAVHKIRITSEKREKLLHKITDVADRPYLDKEIYHQNHRYYAGEIASLYGELGELIAVTMFNKVEKRGGMTYQIFQQIDELHLTENLITDITSHSPQDQRTRIKQFLRNKIPDSKYDADLLDSIIDKEIDIVRNNGHEWIEVKNYKHPLQWKDFSAGERYHKTAQQAEKMDAALKMLGIRNQIKLKQIFLNGVDQETAQKFQQLYGIEIIGNIY